MKIKFRIKHNIWWQIVFGVLTIILIAGLVVNCLNLASAVTMKTDLVGHISMTALLAIQLVLLSLFLLNCRYSLTDRHFVLVFAVFCKRIAYDDILLAREDKVNKILLVYYKVRCKGEDKIDYQSINLNSKHFTTFVDSLRSKNPRIIYEDFNIYKTLEEN